MRGSHASRMRLDRDLATILAILAAPSRVPNEAIRTHWAFEAAFAALLRRNQFLQYS